MNRKFNALNARDMDMWQATVRKRIPVTTAKEHDTLSQKEKGDLQGKLIGHS